MILLDRFYRSTIKYSPADPPVHTIKIWSFVVFRSEGDIGDLEVLLEFNLSRRSDKGNRNLDI
jgi:hypothetical protein